MAAYRQGILDQIWHGTDPFNGFPNGLYASDLQGWNSTHDYLTETITRKRPQTVVELGVWKGASVLTMAAAMRDAGIEGTVIAVDTWLGSWDHWTNRTWTADLCPMFGYPNLYHKFVSNVLASGLQDYIVPLPLDSANATRVLKHVGITAGLVHVDGAHDYKNTTDDLVRWWDIVDFDGTIIVDDYDGDGKVWPEVAQAVNDFRRTVAHSNFEWLPYKCRMTKI